MVWHGRIIGELTVSEESAGYSRYVTNLISNKRHEVK